MIRGLDASEMAAGVDRLAEMILAGSAGRAIALVGIRSRGDEVAERLRDKLAASGKEVDFGTLDISLYRDDYEHLRENPKLQGSDITFEVDGAEIVLVDDVLFTGRTIRAALDAISDYGRPGRVELAVLIDRGHRELPVQPDYVGIPLETDRHDHVHVSLANTDGEDKVEIRSRE
ncbi:bifunctional pyr operon transcriptional regulator/uracil phosphoribosyltransferase PyrR [Haloferula sp. A504]|uniref:bifunctional pyr operon transcriptional regulator/uracil phosphoribosyltransferase PyrR n=1 Tax=Haloferula sp. A504 TaxID=3373601 RepID=UPI0031C52687|nr:bifunctional pyr operon transcriptional regulator/uracil phosphoribosyltransferase PyrR [Verrucomicrobiaceae bacterium E54]